MLQFNLVGFVPADVTIRQSERVLWQGIATGTGTAVTLELGALAFNADGQAHLHFSTTNPPRHESPHPDARPLSFAVYDPELLPAP